MQGKKILIVTDAWKPQVNGVVRVIERTVALLTERGYEITVIHPGLFRTMPMPFYPEIPLALFPSKKIKQLIAEASPDAIHIATEGPLGISARNFCKRAGLTFTTEYHTHFPLYIDFYLKPDFGFTALAYRYLRWFHNGSGRTLVHTASLKTDLERHGFRDLVLTPLGVDTELFRSRQGAELPALKKPVFAYLGRIAKEKGVEEFLEADLPGTKLLIGDGPDRYHLEKKYPTGTYFAGYRTGVELAEWLSLADVFVFPSRTETFGLVVLEALACGVPVAAHDVIGPRDILTPGVDGFLSDDLASAATECLSLDKAKCREKALAYSWETSIEAFVENLENVSLQKK